MQVIFFRHGIAEEREAFARAGAPDTERPLTDKGRRRTRRAAAGMLRELAAADVIATSPLTRARQTADILAEACETERLRPERVTLDALEPGGDPETVCRWLAGRGANETVVLVGHEPDLSGLMAWFTTGDADGFAVFKKAGACLVEFASRPGRGDGELVWLLPPAVMRRLAEA